MLQEIKERPLVADMDRDDPDYDPAGNYQIYLFCLICKIAALWQEEFKTFDDLSFEEARDKLILLVEKMDRDGDGKVTEEELTVWIHYVQTKYIYDDTERQWEENDTDKDGRISWQEYSKHTYGFLTDDQLNE